MIRMVVFDMAGTTVDEDNLVYKTVQSAVNAAGYNYSLDEVLAVGAGREKLQAIKAVLAGSGIVDDLLAEKIFARFNNMLDEAYATAPILAQPHALDTFRFLRSRDILVVLNTGYSRKIAEGLLEKLEWQVGRDIDALVTADDVARNRPHPDMIQFAMDKFGITDPATVVKVGDSAIDIEEGFNAGCTVSIGITTGAHTVEQLQKVHPTCIINDLKELETIVFSSPHLC